MPTLIACPPVESGAPGGANPQLDFHPGMGMRWEITRSTEDSFESTNWIDPGLAGPPVHVHPHSEESFDVLEGEMEFLVDKEWRTVGAGGTATVPAGVPHTLRNASDQPAKMATRIRPAVNSEAFFRDLQRLTHERDVVLPPKSPRSAIYAAMVFGKYPDDIRVTKPPNAVFKGLALLGRALRFKL